MLLLVVIGLTTGCKDETLTLEPIPVPIDVELTPTIPSILTPMATMSPTILAFPTLEESPNINPNGLTADKCLVEQQLLPYVCGIVPGQTSQEEVQDLIGNPKMIDTDTRNFIPYGPGWETVDTCWTTSPWLVVYFSDGIVLLTASGLRANALTLGEAVQVLGPPEQVILYLQYDAAPLEWKDLRANMAIFLWPSRGIYLDTPLYGTTGVELDESARVPLFPADLSIYGMVTFVPCSLEELQAYFVSRGHSPDLPGEKWVDWTGLEE